MSSNTTTLTSRNVLSTLNELQEEVTRVEQALIEIQRQKQEALQHQLNTGINNLAIQADTINALADSLSKEILKFKDIAVEVNQLHLAIHKPMQSGLKSVNFGAMKNLRFPVPIVIKSESQFLLTIKKIELYQQNQPQSSLL
jgi:hypothetical protein